VRGLLTFYCSKIGRGEQALLHKRPEDTIMALLKAILEGSK